jgi:hypothetical protein
MVHTLCGRPIPWLTFENQMKACDLFTLEERTSVLHHLLKYNPNAQVGHRYHKH